MNLDSVYAKLDIMNEHVSSIRESMARIDAHTGENTRNIREHIRRTDLLEDEVGLLKVQLGAQRKVFMIASSILGVVSTMVSSIWVWGKIIG